MTENVAVLLAPLVAALAGLVMTWLDSRSERQRRVRRTDRASSQLDFIERWLDLRERVLAAQQAPSTIDQDLLYAYDQAVRAERADIQPPKRSLWRRLLAATIPPAVLDGGWARFWRGAYWVFFSVGLPFVVLLGASATSVASAGVTGSAGGGVGLALFTQLFYVGVFVPVLLGLRSLCLRAEAWRDRRHARSREAERADGTRPAGAGQVPQRLPPAGWYPSPDGPGYTWWDGERWTVPRQDTVSG